MSSANAVIQVVGRSDNTLEFWAAEVPEGRGEEAFRHPGTLGSEHPAFAFQMLHGSNHYDQALARALDGREVHEPSWLEQHLDDFVCNMELVLSVPRLMPLGDFFDAWDRSHDQEAFLIEHGPRALYRVKVADPSWLQHLRKGMRFGTSAYTPAPFQAVAREPTHRLETGIRWSPLHDLMGAHTLQEPLHVIRNHFYAPRALRAGCYGPEGPVDVSVANEIHELFLESGGGYFIYMNAGAPRFRASSYPFAEGSKALPSKLVGMRRKGHPAGPFGFDLRPNGVELGSDGVPRLEIAGWAPGGKKVMLELDQPRVRLATLLDNEVDSDWVSIESYLATLVETTQAHIEGLIGAV